MVDLNSYKTLTYKIIGASMRVHQELGYGLLEAIYEEALVLELEGHGIECETEKEVSVYYRNHLLKKKYRLDLIIGDIVCELKSADKIVAAHRAQLCNYLRLTQKPLGLLINFGKKSLEGERWAYDRTTNECYLVDVNMERLDYDEKEYDDLN